MFTGIIEEMGTVTEIERSPVSTRLTIEASVVMEETDPGASIAINGACVTALDLKPNAFSCDISPETARLTNIGTLGVGDPVNLERPMRLSDRLSGHMVSGHIEGMGRISDKSRDENALIVSIEIPPRVLKYCVAKGSITLDGVSMTINRLDEKGISISVIPHTAMLTTLGGKGVGDILNLESDLIGRYVERLMCGGETASPYIKLEADQKP
jgi:riboflavin synthase